MACVPHVSGQARPLVVTLEIDDAAQARFDRERTALFPTGRTAVGAHVTLFHALPSAQEPDVITDLTAAASTHEPFEIEVRELMSLGAGVAYRLFRPHVTVQNKVSPEVARRTLAELRERFAPFLITARALRLWRYDGGPWTYCERFPLRSPLRKVV